MSSPAPNRESIGSARSNESIEFAEIVKTKEKTIGELSQLQELAQKTIQHGVELGKNSVDTTYDDEDDETLPKNNSFETEDLDNSTAETAGTRAVTESDQGVRIIQACEYSTWGGDDEALQGHEDSDNFEIFAPDWIGNVRCFWHDKNGRPRITIGPSWGFSFFLGGIVIAVLWLDISAIVKMFENDSSWAVKLGAFAVMGFGLTSFFMTFLGNPGIPEEVYKYKAMNRADWPRKAHTDDKGNYLCTDCNVYVTRNREHCSLCNVCVDNLDHHCVFFSKCIGGGNILWFRMTLVGFVLNMTYFVIIYGFIAMKGAGHKGVHQPSDYRFDRTDSKAGGNRLLDDWKFP